MKIIDVKQGTPEWLELRRGKISGTILGDIYSKRGGRKIGYYQIIAERLGLDPDEENRMDRGLRLEEEAIAKFVEQTHHKVIRPGLCISDFSDDVINSPDGLIKVGKKYAGAVEVKCLSPARHLQAVIEDKVPPEFEAQMLQYFIVNDELDYLYFIFYDPRVPSIPYHDIRIHREPLLEKIAFFKQWQIDTLKEINETVERLAF